METGGGLVKTIGMGTRGAIWFRRLGGLLLDQLYPPVCLVCDKAVLSADALCADCFRQLRPITPPLCPRLGLPFAVSPGPDVLSAEALADPPPFGRARSAVVYNDMAATLVSRLKYGDRPELARFCARLMAGAGHELWLDKPVLVPVPLHRSRQFSRRYNQSAEIARALGAMTGLSVDPLLVSRRRRTRQQVGLPASERHRNVAGAFAAHPDALRRLAGRAVVLVDDVFTTGSTLRSVTHVLARAGIEQIDVISFGRVVFSSDIPI